MKEIIDNRISQVIAIVLFLIGVTACIIFRYQQREIDAENKVVIQKIDDYDRKIERANVADSDLIQQDKNKDSKMSDTVELAQRQNKLVEATDQLFSILVTYNSQETWLARKDDARPLVTDQVLNDKSLFNDGKDNTGNSIIEALGLSSKYDNVEVDADIGNEFMINGLAHVNYVTTSGEDKTKTEHTDYYQVSYDLKNKKFTQVEFLGSES